MFKGYMKMNKYFQRTWTVTQDTLNDLQKACELLETDNASYALRRAISLGVRQLEISHKQYKEEA